MKLKRVRIIGFKTFADRTEIDFDGDLIAIVGPNGCGKSNIVDAILWGLGEPNSRHLRATTSVDVIFNGSLKRKPVGYAEVTLVFDNEDGLLPIAASEVAITRRVTRAGDSSYWINKKACRLKDIFDLLADSGLGRSGYSIVGQREIDQALSASPEDRRAWIDEAAGVQRYRVKRVETMKRLEGTAVELHRAEQIIADLQIQRAPLEAEAVVAEEYLRLRDALASLETALLANDVKKAVIDVEALQQKIANSSLLINKLFAASDENETQQKHLGEEISELERKFDAIRELRQSQITNSERALSEIKLCRQRISSLQDMKQTLGSENENAGILQSEAAEIAERERLDYEATKEQLNALLGLVGASSSFASSIQSELSKLDEEISVLQNKATEYLRWQTEQAQQKLRLNALQTEMDGVHRTLPNLESNVWLAVSELEKLKETQVASHTKVQETKTALRTFEETKAESSRQERVILSNIAQKQGRIHGIEATLEAHEGMSQGAQAVMNLVQKGELTGTYTPVVNAITIGTEFAQAIETALGGNIHDIIVSDDRQAKEAVLLLKDRKLGRATFQPLSMMRPSQRHAELKNLANRAGCLGVAADLITCDAKIRPVIESLLGRILVCETIDDALSISKTQGWSRLVTLDGEVIHFAGSVTGGRNNRQTSGLVARRAELNELQTEVASLEATLKRFARENEVYDSKREEFAKNIEGLEGVLQSAISNTREQEDWSRKLESELQMTLRERDRWQKEKDALVTQLETQLETPEEPTALLLLREEIFTQSVQQATDAAMAKTRLSEADEANRNAKRRFEEAIQRQRQAENSSVKRTVRLQEIESEIHEFLLQIDRFEKQSLEAISRSELNADQLKKIEIERLEMVEQSLKLSEIIKGAQHTVHQLSLQNREYEIERVRAESKRANAVQRLTEEYGLTQENAMEHVSEIEIPADAQSTVNKLRREMRALGNVNIGAVEAFKALTIKYNEMTAQFDDIMSAKTETEKAIKELDRLTRERFLTAFENVKREFSITFKKLFDGGEAELSLTDTEHLLSAGVNIDLTIPGKKRQKLELLSGGERSLCACAFLFALLRVRPSPIVILDEVDAPLDGRNVERYIDLMKSFVGTTQFLMITHNPVTIEAAPVWFGVTMQEPGVSIILPFRAPENMALGLVVVNDKFLKPIVAESGGEI